VLTVTLGALTVNGGKRTPAPNVTVRVAAPEIKRMISPPSKVEAIERAPCASSVALTPPARTTPSVNVSVPATTSVSGSPEMITRPPPPVLLIVTLLSVSEPGTPGAAPRSIAVSPTPSNTTVPPFEANVPLGVKFEANEVVVDEAVKVPPDRVKLLLKSIAPLPPVNVPSACVNAPVSVTFEVPGKIVPVAGPVVYPALIWIPVTVVSTVIVQFPRPFPSKMARSAGPGAVVLGGPPEELDQLALTLKLPGDEAIQNLLAADTGREK